MGQTFRWSFGATIRAKNGAFGVERDMDLPFVPAVGLEVHGVFWEDSRDTIESVWYDVSGGIFTVIVEDGRGWDCDFTAEHVRGYLDYGCIVDSQDSVAGWLALHARGE